jgi:hypothetical protein
VKAYVTPASNSPFINPKSAEQVRPEILGFAGLTIASHPMKTKDRIHAHFIIANDAPLAASCFSIYIASA